MFLSMTPHFSGLGAMPQTATGPGAVPNLYDSSLNHNIIPYKGSPYYLRLVNTEARARQYAAAGFHVSVARGLAGGCGDLAANIQGGKPGASCALPLHRDALMAQWAGVADAYRNAYNRLGTVDQIKFELVGANKLADAAYAAEGIDPPRDPELVAAAVTQGVPLIAVPTEGAAGASVGIGGVKGAFLIGGLLLGIAAVTYGGMNSR